MSIKKVISAQKAETESVIKPYLEDYKEEFNKLTQEIDNWTESDIQKEFGTFLYKALGNVNGSAVRIKNEIDDNVKGGYWSYDNSSTISEIVTAKRFGFRFTSRTNTNYLSDRELFAALVDAHVTSIKRPNQRECAMDFLKFKKCYLISYDNLHKELNEKVFPISVPAKFASFINVRITGHKMDISESLLDNVLDGEITGFKISMPSVSALTTEKLSTFKMSPKRMFNNQYKDPGKNEAQITFTGKIGEDDVKFNVPFYMYQKNGQHWDDSINSAFQSSYYDNTPKMLNLADLFRNEAVKRVFGQIIDQNKSVSKAFEYTRLKYTKNIILNGMF